MNRVLFFSCFNVLTTLEQVERVAESLISSGARTLDVIHDVAIRAVELEGVKALTNSLELNTQSWSRIHLVSFERTQVYADFILRNLKISAIKQMREDSHIDLVAAKNAIDELQDIVRPVPSGSVLSNHSESVKERTL